MKKLFIGIFLLISLEASATQAQCKQTMLSRLDGIDKKLAAGDIKPIQVSSNGETLYVSGTITSAMASAFNALTSSQKSKIKFVVLNSPGGQVVSADPIAKWVHSRHNAIKVVVPNEGICASACTTIFRCAWNRSANANSYLLFHPASMNEDGKSALRQKWGRLGDFVGDAMAAGVTVSGENDECAKSDQSSGSQTISKEVLKGREFCHRADELNRLYPNYLDLDRGMLDDVPTTPGVHVTK